MAEIREVWKEVPDYKGAYEVSNKGNVRSYKTSSKFGKNRNTPNLLTLQMTETGYYQVILYKNNKYKHHKVHRLVAEEFIQNTKNKPQINHIDGVKTNNKADNLEWCTRSENNKHAYDIGLNHVSEYQKKITSQKNRGSGHGNSKLYEKDVVRIKKMRSQGMTYKEIAAQLPVSYDTVGNIVRGETWTHVKDVAKNGLPEFL